MNLQDEPLKAGDLFGDFVVERQLGKGGMATVYLVRSPDGSPFAVKIMHSGKMTHDLRRRFAHEAEFAMNIRHKNLISVYDVGEDPDTGLCYIIMDYVPGGTLADLIKAQGHLSVGQAVKITVQIAAALEVAHRNGLVHRDVKPDNIMFDEDGTPKLADLGVAKFEGDRNTTLTMTGMIIGTPAYMSPEQLIDSHKIDARADIYSLGVVLYEMLSGRRPNSGSTAVELLAKAIRGEELPDIRTMNPEISAAIAHVLSLMCAPKPEDRPATSIEAAKLLHRAATGRLALPKKPPCAAEVAARKRKRFVPFAAVVAGTVLLAGAAAFGWWTVTNKQPSPVTANVTVITNDVERVRVLTNVVVRDVVHERPGSHPRPALQPSNKKPARPAATRASTFEQRNRHHGREPAPGWITISPGETFDARIMLDAATTGDGKVRRALCSYYPQTNKYQTVRWYGGVPDANRFDTLPETGDVYIRAYDEGCHLIDVDIVCDFNVLCNKVVVDFSKIDGAIPYDKSTFEYKTFTRDWRKEHVKQVRISLTHPWIVAQRDEILKAAGSDHVDYAHRAYSVVVSEFKRSGDSADISETIERKRGDGAGLASVFISLLRSAGIPARMLCGKTPDGNLVLCPEFYVEGCGWIPADIIKDIGNENDTTHFGVYDNTCAILSSDLDVTIKNAKGEPCHLDRLWCCWWWLYSGAWTPCDARFSWNGAVTTERAYKNRLAKLEKSRSAAEAPTTEKAIEQIVLFPRLDRAPDAWAYSFDLEKGWNGCDFDDSNWSRAPGGFGMRESNGQLCRARLNTTWNTKTIFLRKRFTWNGGDVSRAVIDAYHDDDVTIWLNGRLLMTANDSNSDCQPFEVPADRFRKALKTGENVFCAEVRNTWHCQYFDCGLLVECNGVPTPHAGPDCAKKVKTVVGTWTVVVKNGVAQIGNGTDAALNPRPKGQLAIPSELDGLPIGKLASRCFMECGELESVIIPEGVRSVGQMAFSGCKRLSDVTTPKSLEHIGIEAFHGTMLKRMDFKNVRLIEIGAFRSCESLNKISVNSDNPTFVVKDGVLYDKIRRAVALCPRSRKSYVFPVGIEDVYDYAFQKCKIKNIVIPATVQAVGHCAFNECPLLESVKFKGEDVLISSWAFGNTPSLRSVVLPSRLKTLYDWAIFNHAGKLESIVLPDTVESIGDAVFENCPRLKSISLGKSLRRVGNHVFAGCRQLQAIEFPETLRELGAEVFLNCEVLKTVTFAGDAPELRDQGDRFGIDMYKGTSPLLVTVVPKDANGWTDASGKLPKAWPVAIGESARQIRFSAGKTMRRRK